VYNWVRGHITYTGKSNKNDWRKEAIRGFYAGEGDCFTFYSVTRALLEELGIEYMTVTRLGGSTHHWWVIVNIGTGWYHFDPLISRRHRLYCFMWTTEQCDKKPGFWSFDATKYPAIATEPFDYDAVVQAERDGLLP